MKQYKINMYQVPIIKIYRVKQYWTDWLKYRLPIPKKITPVILKNLLGGYKWLLNMNIIIFVIVKYVNYKDF